MKMDGLYIAWRYVCFHKVKTAILVASITLIVFLPAGVDALVNEIAEQLRSRAAETPLIVGAKGSEVELVLNTLYFESDPPAAATMAEVERIRRSGFAEAVPLYVRFRARGRPIVGTTLDYLDFRGLQVRAGRRFALLGECVLGGELAATLGLVPGDTLLSTSENVFDLGGVYPLEMHVVGVLGATGTPDDSVIFADVKTTWIIAGLGHGHQDVSKPGAANLLLGSDGNRFTANAAVTHFTEVTPANIDAFHFHGDPADFPITAVIALPHDEKSRTLLMGRYQSAEESAQVVRPEAVMDDLLATILRVRGIMLAGAFLLGVATLLSVTLVFALSLRLRRRELATMAKLGCSRLRISSIVALEILLVAGLSIGIAAALTMITRRLGAHAIRWFLL